MTAEIFAALGAVLCSAIVGVIAYIAHLAIKGGQKQAEAVYEKQRAQDTQKAAAIVAERRDPNVASDRLHGGTF